MANKPVPKQIVVEKITNNIINIYTSSNDARDEMIKRCPEFGIFVKAGQANNAGYSFPYHHLVIHPTYNTGEVVKYIEELV